MDVLLLKRPEKYTVMFSLLINAGSIFESRKTSGISHFFEHLLFNGTKTYPTEELLRNRHQELGLSIGATTNYDFIELSGYFPTVSMKDALIVIHEMVFESLISTQMIRNSVGLRSAVFVEARIGVGFAGSTAAGCR
jgi:predicted Zn-dependent peptidase